MAAEVVSIVLAAGQGTRMGPASVPKVCSQVAGVPFILRCLQSLQDAGIEHHLVVIGATGSEIVHTVAGRLPGVYFAIQPIPLGTGNAARCGMQLLAATGYKGGVLVTMGDRLVAPRLLRQLLGTFAETDSDLVLLVGPQEHQPDGGRVLEDCSGRLRLIVETSDIRLSALVRAVETVATAQDICSGPQLQSLIGEYFPREQKARTACGPLYEMAASRAEIPSDEVRAVLGPLREQTTISWEDEAGVHCLAAYEVETRARYANLGCYLFRAPVLWEGLNNLGVANAQGEEYLTDAVKHVCTACGPEGELQYRVATVVVEDADEALTFNTQEELAKLERRLRVTERSDLRLVPRPNLLHARNLRTVAEWHMLFSLHGSAVRSFLSDTYGPNLALQETKRSQYLQALECYAQHYDLQDEVFLVRSPGRLNLLGRHIDHRGGYTNVVAISEEVLMVCAPREDDLIELHNTDGRQYREGAFAIGGQAKALSAGSWQRMVNSAQHLAQASEGLWVNYFKAAALRLQAQFPEIILRGLNIVTHGTIPVGAGLSSSSALVVGASEALIARNCLPVHAHLEVDLCGEGEWFVGTRGGAGDHAAIKFGRREQVVRFSFMPFRVDGSASFFPKHRVVVCNSGIQAKKSETARATFNRRVLGYIIGEVLFKRLYPQYAPRVHHLRDITTENLKISLDELYRLLKGLPEEIAVEEAFAQYGPFDAEDQDRIESVLTTLPPSNEPLAVRGVVLFGLAECERSALCLELLKRGDVESLGRLWYLSHDGDRIVEHDENMRPVLWNYSVDDAYLDRLIGWLGSGDAELARRAQLHLQPGAYACSTPELDKIVDTARRVPGVKGAQMAGAGLGGCVMVLVEEAAADRLLRRLTKEGWTAGTYEFVEGAGLVVI